MERQKYTLTELAGSHVAGRRISDRAAPLLLTEEEARLELLAGTIRPAVKVATTGKATGQEREGIAVTAAESSASVGEPDSSPVKPASKRR